MAGTWRTSSQVGPKGSVAWVKTRGALMADARPALHHPRCSAKGKEGAQAGRKTLHGDGGVALVGEEGEGAAVVVAGRYFPEGDVGGPEPAQEGPGGRTTQGDRRGDEFLLAAEVVGESGHRLGVRLGCAGG